VKGCFIRCYNSIQEKPNLEVIYRRSHSVGSDIIGNNSETRGSGKKTPIAQAGSSGTKNPPSIAQPASSRMNNPPGRPPAAAQRCPPGRPPAAAVHQVSGVEMCPWRAFTDTIRGCLLPSHAVGLSPPHGALQLLATTSAPPAPDGVQADHRRQHPRRLLGSAPA
jgi:hypothetical protein